jgi:prophage antirepressor-like protein
MPLLGSLPQAGLISRDQIAEDSKTHPLRSLSLAPAPAAQPQGTPEFTFKDQKVRVVMLEGSPWFVATDVLRVLGMNPAQVSNYLRHLNTDEKQLLRKTSPNLSRGVEAWFRYAPTLTAISESGLYKLVMRSDKPEAKAFQDWVTREVLPTLRRGGRVYPLCQVGTVKPTPRTYGRSPHATAVPR